MSSPSSLGFRLALLPLLALCAHAAVAGAQAEPATYPLGLESVQDPVLLDPATYGPETVLTIINSSAFVPWSSTATYSGAGGYLTGSSGHFYTPLQLPTGAKITAMCAWVRDADPTYDVDLRKVTREWDWDDPDGNASWSIAVISSGSSGYQIPCTTPSFPVRILHYGDFDNDGHINHRDHYLDLSGLGADRNLAAVAIFWQRDVSPPPATATFGDVPTSHPFFQQIEALSASGITSGCGGGDFCPGDPLTRGQMAAFLAKALGLHWPY